MVAAVNAHHVFAFHGSVGRNFFKGIITISHGIDLAVREETESIRGDDIFAGNSIFFLFSSVFGSLFSLGFGIEVRKLTSFDLSDFGIISLFSEFFGILENFLDHDIIWIFFLFFG
jgi:hypothetical protein